MSEKIVVTDAQVKAAQMIVDRDRAAGRETDEATRKIAEAKLEPVAGNRSPQATLAAIRAPAGKSSDLQVEAEVSPAQQANAVLAVWRFQSPYGADAALQKLQDMQVQQLTLQDAALVSWEPGKKKPKTRALDPTEASTLGGGFWGLLFGLIFFIPILGLAIGAGAPALFGSLADLGISDSFIQNVRDKVTPGTSALFTICSYRVLERIMDEFEGTDAELISTSLSDQQEATLREVFARED